jgi:hypothetical protein
MKETKILVMNHKISILLAGLVLVLFSCADSELGPVLTFETAGKGAYVKLLQEGDRDINLFDIEGSSYTYSVEFVDIDMGNTIAEYKLDMIFEDKNPSNGDNSKPAQLLRSFSASEFTSTDRGFKGVSNITIKATDLIAKVGVNAADLLPGDNFKIIGTIVTNDGDVFGAKNSSAAINGTAFAGHFDFILRATCPTTIGGTYTYETVATWCGEGPGTGEVTLTLTSSGYDIDDFSLGAYDVCYGAGSAKPLGTLRLVDVCNKISVAGASQWGEIYTFHSLTVDGASFTLEWTNDYGEGGTSKLTRKDGVALPPLRL